MAKFVGKIILLLDERNIAEVKKMINVVKYYGKKIHYDYSVILDLTYYWLGEIQLSLFQDDNKLSDKHNYQRVLILLGANKRLNCTLSESIFGTCYSNPK